MIAEPEALLLRLDLGRFVPSVLPTGFRFAAFDEKDAGEVERLLVAVRADGLAGEAEKQRGWFERVRRDPEWEAGLVILVRDEADGSLAGVAHCWTGAYLKDLGVAAAYRGGGLAQALVGEAARRFAARGEAHLDLKVRPANGPARRLYERLGFRPVAA